MRFRCVVLLGLAALPFVAQGQISPADALRSPAKSIKASDLPDTMRAVAVGEGAFNSSSLMALGAFSRGGATDNARSAALLGLIGTTFVDPDEFAELLEGKRPRIRGYMLDLAAMITDSPRGESGSVPEPVFAETWIEGGRIDRWSPRPGLTRASILETFSRKPTAGPAVKSRALSNGKQVALGIIMYSSDADDVYPYADSTAKAQEVVLPYVQSRSLWTSPRPEGGRLLYNTALSGLSATAIEDPAETPLVWDERPWEDGGRIVAFADGHANYVTAEEWQDRIWAYELRRRAERRVPSRPARAAGRP